MMMNPYVYEIMNPYVYDELSKLPMCGVCCKRSATVELVEWRHFEDCAWLAKYHAVNSKRLNLSGVGLAMLIGAAFWAAVFNLIFR